MWTTFSFSSRPWDSMRRGAPRGIALLSDLEAGVPRPFRHRTHAAVVEESVPIEDCRGDPPLETALPDRFADRARRRDGAGLLQLTAHVGRQGRGGEERSAVLVGDHLHV